MSAGLAGMVVVGLPRSIATHKQRDLAIRVKVPQPPRIEHRLRTVGVRAETEITDQDDCGAILGIKFVKCGYPSAMLRCPAKTRRGYGGVAPPFTSDMAFPD